MGMSVNGVSGSGGNIQDLMGRYDQNANGKLDSKEIDQLAKQLGISREELMKFDGACGGAKDGELDACELGKAMEKLKGPADALPSVSGGSCGG
jgi:hypothetical protein